MKYIKEKNMTVHLKKLINDCSKDNNSKLTTKEVLTTLLEYIKEQAVASEEIVKQGEWQNKSNIESSKHWICSECQGLVETAHYCCTCYYNYCPQCGAKMKQKRRKVK